MRPTKDPRAGQVLSCWFGTGNDYGKRRKEWFQKDAAFDAAIRERFLALHEEGARRGLESWTNAVGDCLALIVLLDQFPRNMFRGSARAFASDALARDAAGQALQQGHDRGLLPVERMFVYLPFEHSEALQDQLLCRDLMRPLEQFEETKDVYDYAVRHHAIIARFGRFPHRNEALGRASTPEEIEFLKQPGSGF
ncbi:MAG TPA: DUF924 family protein [Burkholderiales bacterium]|nr:DUF924 family protein [Burkholderiales bacterium]